MKEALKLALEALEDSEDHLAKPYSTDARRAITAIKAALEQPEERNFCQRCGKRTADLTMIHTCTPPQEKNHG